MMADDVAVWAAVPESILGPAPQTEGLCALKAHARGQDTDGGATCREAPGRRWSTSDSGLEGR